MNVNRYATAFAYMFTEVENMFAFNPGYSYRRGRRCAAALPLGHGKCVAIWPEKNYRFNPTLSTDHGIFSCGKTFGQTRRNCTLCNSPILNIIHVLSYQFRFSANPDLHRKTANKYVTTETTFFLKQTRVNQRSKNIY